MGEKSKVVDGVRVIDEESFHIILKQIQKFSDLGQKKAADVLDAFLKDLQTRKVPAGGMPMRPLQDEKRRSMRRSFRISPPNGVFRGAGACDGRPPFFLLFLLESRTRLSP